MPRCTASRYRAGEVRKHAAPGRSVGLHCPTCEGVKPAGNRSRAGCGRARRRRVTGVRVVPVRAVSAPDPGPGQETFGHPGRRVPGVQLGELVGRLVHQGAEVDQQPGAVPAVLGEQGELGRLARPRDAGRWPVRPGRRRPDRGVPARTAGDPAAGTPATPRTARAAPSSSTVRPGPRSSATPSGTDPAGKIDSVGAVQRYRGAADTATSTPRSRPTAPPPSRRASRVPSACRRLSGWRARWAVPGRAVCTSVDALTPPSQRVAVVVDTPPADISLPVRWVLPRTPTARPRSGQDRPQRGGAPWCRTPALSP